jgi:hypothetical protein
MKNQVAQHVIDLVMEKDELRHTLYRTVERIDSLISLYNDLPDGVKSELVDIAKEGRHGCLERKPDGGGSETSS